MAGRDDLPQLVILDIKLAGVIVDEVAGELDVVLHDAEAAEVLLQEGSLNQLGVAHYLPHLRPLQHSVVGGLHVAPAPGILELLGIPNFTPASSAITGGVVVLIAVSGALAAVSALQAKLLNVAIMHQALHDTVSEARVTQVLQARQKLKCRLVVAEA